MRMSLKTLLNGLCMKKEMTKSECLAILIMWIKKRISISYLD